MFAAKVWHYWIAVPLAIGAVRTALAVVAGYLKRVQSVKYPRS
jgi:formate-dependent nitrite reductase membrane component NrfD